MSKGGGGGYQPSGNTTTTSTASPWEPQQPYLNEGFQMASQLYDNSGRNGPAYYPGMTYAPQNWQEQEGIQRQYDAGVNSLNQANAATGANQLIGQGNALYGNPALNPLLAAGSQNLGTSNAGTGAVQNIANGNISGFNTKDPYAGLLALGGQNAAYANPAFGSLAGTANGGAGVGGFAQMLASLGAYGANLQPALNASGAIASSGSPGALPDQALLNENATDALGLFQPLRNSLAGYYGGNNPAQAASQSGTDYLNRLLQPGNNNVVNFGNNIGGNALGQIASGSQINPYLDALSQSTSAAVLPGIQSQFIRGGGLSSPQAAYASTQGVTAALAPVLNQALQAQQQNQLTAATNYGNLFQQGVNSKAQAALDQANIAQGLSGQGLQALNTASNLRLGQLGASNQAAQAAGNLALGSTGLQNTAANTFGNLALGQGGLQSGAAQAGGNLNIGNANAQTAAGSALGSQILSGQGQQTQNFSQALASALGFGGLQNQAGLGLGQEAISGQNALTQALSGAGGLYGTAAQQQLGAQALLPSLLQSGLGAAGSTLTTGQQQQGFTQADINDAIQRWNYAQTAPYNALNQFIGSTTGNYGGTATQTNPYYLNQGANTAASALGGAGVGGTIGGGLASAIPALGLSSGAGSGIGAGLGLLLGLL